MNHFFRLVFAIVLTAAAVNGRAQASGVLSGRVEGRTYYSPTGAFKIELPVLPDLGGSVTDTSNVVTFDDDFSTHISIGVFPQDPTQRWELSIRGIKDYLIYFFTDFVLKDFSTAYKDVEPENTARFLPDLDGGAFVTYILLPGGSMFANKVPMISAATPPPVAKRGNMIFVKSGFIYVISTELAERVTEGSAYNKTSDEEDSILRERLIDIAGKIQFLSPPPAAGAADAK